MIWTGGTASAPNLYPIFEGKKKVSVRRFIWEDVRGPIPAGNKLEMSCGNTLCINVKHMVRLAPGEVLRGDTILQFDPEDYEALPCDTCGTPCKVRGKHRKGLSRGFVMEDGSRICGKCHRAIRSRESVVDNSPHVEYAGSTDDLLTDVEWLLDSDESGHGAATRLGFDSQANLFKVLKKLDRGDLVSRFLNQDVVMMNSVMLHGGGGGKLNRR